MPVPGSYDAESALFLEKGKGVLTLHLLNFSILGNV